MIQSDTFTFNIAIWSCFQLVWVTMLVSVQLLQLARGQTTYENMHSQDIYAHAYHDENKVASVVASAIAAGTVSLEGAQLTPGGMGPNPALPHTVTRTHLHNQKCWSRTIKLLGLDTFMRTAQDTRRGRSQRARDKNPFSRGAAQNCRDFWCDPRPIFISGLNGDRTAGNGEAVLGGVIVDYYYIYESPRMEGRSARGGYHSVPADEEV